MHVILSIVAILFAIVGIYILAKKSIETDVKSKMPKYVKEHRKVVGGVLLAAGAIMGVIAFRQHKQASSASTPKFFYF